jgi:hypothetical protein
MANRAFIVHGHFYQPPREDPLTGIIPREQGAAPFANWNERIHAECYRPNAELGNFEKISFNVGPTLCLWMEQHDPQTCKKIVEQDRANVRRHGVGNAMAQAYNHTILPLASYQDKRTQVAWGIADFEHRFGRRPQGMWLPETGVDLEALEVLHSQGIQFTIMAPWQAADEEVDITQPYRVPLAGGKDITVFFYQRELSARVSFDAGATINADSFAQHVLQPYFTHFAKGPEDSQVIVLASDGELYGHHQYLRDRFLERLVDGASRQLGIRPTYPALWLKEHPAQRIMQIRENTSWSCHHGVDRWRSNCGCTPGKEAWKSQLRLALETLAQELDELYVSLVKGIVSDPWELRNHYIHVMLGQMGMDQLLQETSGQSLPREQVRRIQWMLEAQRERQRMFTSCGWYFEDYDRIEPRNNTAYAAASVHLAKLATGVDLEAGVKHNLDGVVSDRSGLRASQVFESRLRQAERMQAERVV